MTPTGCSANDRPTLERTAAQAGCVLGTEHSHAYSVDALSEINKESHDVRR
jgi:hypothetical protein